MTLVGQALEKDLMVSDLIGFTWSMMCFFRIRRSPSQRWRCDPPTSIAGRSASTFFINISRGSLYV